MEYSDEDVHTEDVMCTCEGYNPKKGPPEANLPAIMTIVILLGIIVGVISYFLFKLKVIAAFTLGLIISYITLNAFYPMRSLFYQRNSYIILTYLIIEIAIPIYLFLFLFLTIFRLTRD